MCVGEDHLIHNHCMLYRWTTDLHLSGTLSQLWQSAISWDMFLFGIELHLPVLAPMMLWWHPQCSIKVKYLCWSSITSELQPKVCTGLVPQFSANSVGFIKTKLLLLSYKVLSQGFFKTSFIKTRQQFILIAWSTMVCLICNFICRCIEHVMSCMRENLLLNCCEDAGDVYLASEEILVGELVFYSCVRCNMAPTNVYSNWMSIASSWHYLCESFVWHLLFQIFTVLCGTNLILNL